MPDCTALLESVSLLRSTCTNLAAKANGGSYGFWAHRRDLSAYKASVARYSGKSAVLMQAVDVAEL